MKSAYKTIYIIVNSCNFLSCTLCGRNEYDIQGVPGGMCQTSGECSLC